MSGADLDSALDAIFHFTKKIYWLFTGRKARFRGLGPDPLFLQAFTVAWYKPRGQIKRRIEECIRMSNR